MSDLFIPPRAFFTFTFRCPYLAAAPRLTGHLRDWPKAALLPDLHSMEHRKSFADVYLGWDETGLYCAASVDQKTQYHIDPSQYTQSDCLELWIDTRDLKDIHRGNRYCHHFLFLPGGSGRDGRQPIGRQIRLPLAHEQAPPCPEDSIRVGLRRLRRGYRLELKIPAEGLNGFEPGEFDRLGFNYVLRDTQKGTQSWSAGTDLPVETDPSLWGTVELVRD